MSLHISSQWSTQPLLSLCCRVRAYRSQFEGHASDMISVVDTAIAGPVLQGTSTSLTSRGTHFRHDLSGHKKQVRIPTAGTSIETLRYAQASPDLTSSFTMGHKRASRLPCFRRVNTDTSCSARKCNAGAFADLAKLFAASGSGMSSGTHVQRIAAECAVHAPTRACPLRLGHGWQA